MNDQNINEYKSQHSRHQDKGARYDMTGHSARPGGPGAQVYRCKVLEYLGVRDGTKRYDVAMIGGESPTELFVIRNCTVADQAADELSVGTYAMMVMQPGEPPVIITGGAGGSGAEYEIVGKLGFCSE